MKKKIAMTVLLFIVNVASQCFATDRFYQIESLIKKYDKQSIVYFILYKSDNHDITVQVENKLYVKGGKPSTKYITVHSISYDFNRLGISIKDADKMIPISVKKYKERSNPFAHTRQDKNVVKPQNSAQNKPGTSRITDPILLARLKKHMKESDPVADAEEHKRMWAYNPEYRKMFGEDRDKYDPFKQELSRLVKTAPVEKKLLDRHGNFKLVKDQDAFIADLLKNIAAQINTQMPLMIDAETQMNHVLALGKTINFTMRLVNHKSHEFDVKFLKNYIWENINDIACKNKATRDLIDIGVSYVYIYFGSDDRFVARVVLDKYKCN